MRVLLVNDDGPPSAHSPHVLGLYQIMKEKFGWDVQVVLPSTQKSWGSMAFSLSPPCSAWYYYPIKGNYDGSHADTLKSWSSTKREIQNNELGEWLLVDGSPTTCANIGLFSLPSNSNSTTSFDLVVSGPNFGRNTGTAFSICSGTIGAALAASLSDFKAISLSYAHFHQPNKIIEEAEKKRNSIGKTTLKLGQLPESAPLEVTNKAHELSCRLIEKLFKEWENDVGVYTINIPLSYNLFDESGAQVYWTNVWDSKFGPLFQSQEREKIDPLASSPGFTNANSNSSSSSTIITKELIHKPFDAPKPELSFKFSPNMTTMLQPPNRKDSLSKEMTDIEAILNGFISISRIRPSYTSIEKQSNNFKL